MNKITKNLLEKVRKRQKLNTKADSSKQIVFIRVDDIYPNPSQPRQDFDEVDIVSLADSIRRHGLLQPISVRRSEKSELLNERYTVVAGERRLRAFKMLGKEEIPCIVIETSLLEAAELAIIENIMRKDLNMFEYAAALSTLIEQYELTQEAIALRLSTSQSNIANKLRLLRFDKSERQFILENSLTERHARTLLRINDLDIRKEAARHIAQHNLSVKQSESYVDKLLIPDGMVRAYDSRYRINDFCEHLIKSVAQINKNGISAKSTRYENESEIKIIINIPKNIS